MAQNENSLGAPTEGLGQNVTFAFDPSSGVPQIQLGGEGQMRGGVRGGGTVNAGGTHAIGVTAPPNPTLDLLMRAGDAILKPYVQKAKTQAFVSGMQRAMQGEAVVDIANSQPWYTKIFGESDVVEGARAYAGHTVAQTQIAAMEDKMPELRKMEPLAAQKFFTDSVQNNLTGDAAADGSILKAMTSALPAVMRRQAKEHYGWQQEVASSNEGAAFKAGADRLQASAKGLADGYTTPEEYKGVAMAFVRSLQPAAGRDIDSYKKSMANNLRSWAASGNFHALNAVTDTGFLDVLDEDQRIMVAKATEAGESKARNKYSMAWSDQLAEIEAVKQRPPEGTSTADLAKSIDAMNTRFKAETGSKLDFILPRERAAYLASSSVAIATERDRQGTAAAKAVDKAAKGDMITKAVTQGWANTLASNPGYSKEEINAVAFPLYQAMPPEQRRDFLVKNQADNYVIDPVKNILVGQVTSALSAGGMTPDVQRIFKDYSDLADKNQTVADAYYGEHATNLSKFKHAVENGFAPEGAFADIFVNGKGHKPVSDKDIKTGVSVLTKEHNDWLPWGNKFQPGQARRLANMIGDSAVQFGDTNGDEKGGWKRAYVNAQTTGTELLGGYVWKNQKDQVSLSKYLSGHAGPLSESPVAVDNLNDAFHGAVKQLLYGGEGEKGILPDNASDVAVIRLQDRAGIPQFHVQSVIDGKTYDGLLSGADIFKLDAKQRATDKARSITRAAEAGTAFEDHSSTAERLKHLPNIVGAPTR